MAQQIADLQEEIEQLKDELSELQEYQSDEDDLEEEDDVLMEQDFKTCIIVDNLPIVPEAKFQKLLAVIKKIYTQVGSFDPETGLYMPVKDGSTCGYAIIDFSKPEEALKAVQNTNGWKLDKKHIFKVNLYDDFKKFNSLPETYEDPPEVQFEETDNVFSWLEDSESRDQYVVRYDNETEIHWSKVDGNSALDYGGDREKTDGKTWCELYVQFSPQGAYLSTYHRRGIALWGGKDFQKIGRFAHNNVRHIEYSPRENYFITYSDVVGDQAVKVWSIATQKVLRPFKNLQLEFEGSDPIPSTFKWSHDDKYVARLQHDLARNQQVISFYETPGMQLLDKKSLKATGAREFFWSPTDNIIAYWSPEMENVAARVALVEMPSRKEIRQKNLFSVSSCKIHWHPMGKYLCVKVCRHSKSKKTFFTNFELFRVKEDLVPVEMMEMKETVVAFAWEPNGDRFAVCHGEGNIKLNVSFFTMCGGKGKNELEKLYTLEGKSANHLYWSPMGNLLILAGLGDGMNGALEFWDADNQTSLGEKEHYKCTHVEWDPSGRMVATSVAQPLENFNYKYQMDNGFKIWSFQGQLLKDEAKDKLFQFRWRPRPKSLLSDDEQQRVIRDIKKYERKYQENDKSKQRAAHEAERARKESVAAEFRKILDQRRAEYMAEWHPKVVQLCDGQDFLSNDGYEVMETEDEQEIEKHEEVVR
jgi:translation initiation factor 3 subunit B